MKILITGATGYIGHKLAMEAAARNYTVHILVRDPQSKNIPVHPNIVVFKGDITDRISVLNAMYGCEKVMHTAALTKLWDKDSSLFYKINVEGTRNMLDAAFTIGVKKFVFTSTGAVIGPSGKFPMNENDPRIIPFENDYEISKHWAEELVKEYCRKGLFAIIVSAPRVYGPGPSTGGNVLENLMKKMISTGIAFVPSYGEVLGNYAYVDDVVNGHFLAMNKGLGGEKYILGGENISYTDFFNTIRSHSGKPIRFIRIPKVLLMCWSFIHMNIYRLLGMHTNISPKTINRISQNRALSCDKAIRQLGYSITPFTSGIQKTILHLQTKNYA